MTISKSSSIFSQLGSTKSIEHLIADANSVNFAKSLTSVDLIMMGIGAVIGSGIFVLPGVAAAKYAGPAVILSFVVAGVVAGLAGICYAELSSIVPVAGSSYTYTYATLGEFAAWLVAWNALLGCLVSAAVGGVGWSAYFMNVVSKAFGGRASEWNQTFLTSPWATSETTGGIELTGGLVNLPAVCIVLCIMVLLIFGTKKSTVFNTVVVFIKLVVIVVVTIALFTKIDVKNLEPFIPPNTGIYGQFGWSGIMKGASLVFFAYLGFDMVSTTAQECKNPQRDLPIGIIGSLLICTLTYMLVCVAMTGSVHYSLLGDDDHPISFVVEYVGLGWLAIIVDLGAVVGLLSVIITMLMGAPRVLFIMGRDGLMPPVFTKVHPKFQTPYISTIICGTISACCAGLFPINILAEISSVGTLYAFCSTAIGLIVLRVRRPDLNRPFKVPLGNLLPALAALSSFGLICMSGTSTLILFVGWSATGTIVYFIYGWRHSQMNPKNMDLENISEMDTPKGMTVELAQ